MTILEKLVLDANFNGKLAGQHLRQAQLDIEAADILRNLALAVRPDEVPEESVACYMTKIWCDQTRAFRLKEPLAPSAPEPGLSVVERIRLEVLRWFLAVSDGYTPVPLSPDAATIAIRKEIRAVQLSDQSEIVREQYARALGIQREETK